ncbi:MAG: hypothetical protein OXG84_01175 [Chloroflexi bacterium]|nr:hypothetical protein [Chloroflexota bacterium]
MAKIDKRQHITIRREESKLSHQFGLYHAATLTACNAVELILEMLFCELMEKLPTADPQLEEELQSHLAERKANGDPSSDWSLTKWIDFYEECNIIFELRRHFGYRFNQFKIKNLWKVNKIWNKYKHSFVEPDPATAMEVCSYFKDFLEEIKHPAGEDYNHIRSVGQFSDRWLQDWQTDIDKWCIKNRNAIQTGVLQPLPSLLDIVVGMIADPKFPPEHKTQLMVAANYVFSSVDLMPEKQMDVRGLVDDCAVLVLTLHWLLHKQGLRADLLRRHWGKSKGDIISKIDMLEQYIRANNAGLFATSQRQSGSNLIWANLRKVSSDGPEALWQNYWQEQNKV